MWFGGEVTVTATPTNLTQSLGLRENQSAYFLDLRALTSNVGVVYIGPSSLTATTNRRAFILDGESYTFESMPMYLVDTNDVYLVGTAGDKVLVSGLA